MKNPGTLLKEWTQDLLHVWYPSFCLICDTETKHSGSGVCPVCENELHYTYFENYTEPSRLDQLFWGRAPIHATFTLLYFGKQAGTQSILHALKYKDQPEVARYFGQLMGDRLKTMEQFKDADALIPVPLHPKKEFLRGYNQSKMLAQGIGAEMQLPVRTDLLYRVQFSESQTRKNRQSRWENTQGDFEVRLKGKPELQHVVIVDDVVTTGSTLETCIQLLHKALPETKISIASLAIAR